MGRLIDADKFKEYIDNGVQIAVVAAPLKAKEVEKWADTIIADIEAQPTVEAYSKDVVIAMLLSLQRNIAEIEEGYAEFNEEEERSLTMIPLESVDIIIQAQIDELKGKKKGAGF